jgi:hypothetical protein
MMCELIENADIPQLEEVNVEQHIKKPSPLLPKKRKNVDSNCFELLVAICVCDSSIADKKTIMDKTYDEYKHILLGCNEEQFIKYMSDLKIRSSTEVNEYIKYFRLTIQYVISEKVKYVYLEGKNLTTDKIKELNKNFNKKKAKADVYIEEETGNIIGISVKQDNKCTKTNFSVEKILVNLISDKISKKELRDKIASKRKELLKTHDINGKNIKQCRDEANELFHDENNIYWNELRTQINDNNDAIKNEIVNNIFPIDIPYKLYEFDGTTLERLDIESDMNKVEFSEHKEYYFDNKGLRRKTAKLFYRLVVNEKIYRVEVRFKGNIWSSSAQFQTHYDKHNDTSPLIETTLYHI